jgi:hypothetical protein
VVFANLDFSGIDDPDRGERDQDRILMGKDAYGNNESHVYFRIFEEDDEYVDYDRRRHAF